MILKMYIGKILMAKVVFDFAEMETEDDRQKHIEKIASETFRVNYPKFRDLGLLATFYYETESKMNDFGDYEMGLITLESLKEKHLKIEEV